MIRVPAGGFPPTWRKAPMLKRISQVPLAGLLSAGALFFVAAGFAEAASSVHGAWSVDCEGRAGKAQATCVASQKVATDPEGKKVVLGVIVETATGDKKPRIAFRMTSQAYKQAGIAIKIDDHSPARLKIEVCDEKVCEARGWLTDVLLQQMREGRLLRFAFYIDSKNQITYPVSLDGFGAAFDALRDNK